MVFFFTLNTTKLLKVTCYSCAETRHPRDCNVTTQCHAHQVSDRNSVQSPKIASSLKIMVTISTCSNKNVICCIFDIEYVLLFDRKKIKKIYNQAWLKYFNNIFKAMLAAIFILIFFLTKMLFST